jgi:hypothetical protein
MTETGPSEFQGFRGVGNDAIVQAEAIQARPFLGLQFEELHRSHGLTRRSHAAKIPLGSDQHDSRSADIEDVYTPNSEKTQKFDCIEVIEHAAC